MQDGLTAANAALVIDPNTPITIRVAQGVYNPDDDDNQPNPPGSTHTPLDRNASFVMLTNVTIEGGYKGIVGLCDTTANNRDDFSDLYNPVYETILSGDLQNDDVYSAIGTTLDDMSRNDNSLTVVNGGIGTDDTAELEGVTIRDGHGGTVQSGVQAGAGIIVNAGSSPTFTNCRIIRNWVDSDNSGTNIDEGGGMMLDSSDASPIRSEITNCLFLDNEANKGGGISMHFSAEPIIRNCIFDRNTASNLGGGGMFMKSQADPIVEDCTFVQNKTTAVTIFTAHGGGGALVCDTCAPRFQRCSFRENVANDGNGGALLTFFASPVDLVDCEFIDNRAIPDSMFSNSAFGGAVALENGAGVTGSTVTNCLFRGNETGAGSFLTLAGGGLYIDEDPEITNCLFFDNQAAAGGAIAVNTTSDTKIINCTVVNNHATTQVGGLITSTPLAVTVTNSIFWNNTDPGTNVQDKQICEAGSGIGAVGCNTPPMDLVVTFSDVQDAHPDDANLPFDGGTNNNIDDDPQFEDPDGADNTLGTEDDNYRLTDGSPCLDKGNPNTTGFPQDDLPPR